MHPFGQFSRRLRQFAFWAGVFAACVSAGPSFSQTGTAPTRRPIAHTFSSQVALTRVPTATAEAIGFRGTLVARSRLAHDAQTRRPNLLVEVSWQGIQGSGLSGAKYLMHGTESLVLPVVAGQAIEVDIPVARQAAPQAPFFPVRGTLNLYFNTSTGELMWVSLAPARPL